jgi:hypothetical protein
MTVELGRITSVMQAPEEKRIYVSVKVTPEEYYEEIQFTTNQTGLWMMPAEGDIVEVYEVGMDSYVARTPHNPLPYTMPQMEEGDFALKLNEDTELFFSRQADDTFNLSVKADGNISVSTTSGNVSVDAPSGTITANGVDVENHTHSYTDSTISDTSDGTGSTSTSTKNTDPPS